MESWVKGKELASSHTGAEGAGGGCGWVDGECSIPACSSVVMIIGALRRMQSISEGTVVVSLYKIYLVDLRILNLLL